MPTFSRLRLTSKYVKITSEVDIKEWAKTSEDTVCSVCKKKLSYRDSFELEAEFRSRYECKNHSKTIHFSFRHPKTKKLYDELKPKDEPITVQMKIPRKKKDSKKKATSSKTKNNKKQTTSKKNSSKAD